MDSIQDVEPLRATFRRLKADLEEEWASAVDENGTFVFVFGDPTATPFATRVEVGYTEEEEVYVDIQPASELEGGMEDAQFNELESIAYTEAKHLDEMVGQFAHAIYDYLYGQCHHKSLLYTKFVSLEAAKKDLNHAESRKKAFNAENAHRRKDQQTTEYEFLAKWEQQYSAAKGNEAKCTQLLNQLREREQKYSGGMEGGSPAQLLQLGDLVARMMEARELKAIVFSYTYRQAQAIPRYVRHLRYVQEINFSYNEILVVPQELTALPNLRKLILAGNKLKYIPPLSGCSWLEVLDCHSNEILELPADITHLAQLQTIDFEGNKISVIPEDIGNLKRLQFLNLTRNNVKLIPPQIGAITTLVYLKLAHNPIVNLPAHIYLQGTQASMAYLREYIPEAAHITASSMVSDLALFMNKEQFSDIILRSNTGIQFFAHRIMIDARCPYLYKSVIDAELQKQDMAGLSAALEASAIEAGTVPSTVAKKAVDNKDRLIVDVDQTDTDLEYLLKYIYGDIFAPERPVLIDATLGMTAAESEQVTQFNRSAMAVFEHLCSHVAQVAETFCLHRMAKIAISLTKPGVKIPATSYFKDFEQFSLKPKHSDVSFLVDGRTIMTHKLLLCARSEYFNNMLTGGLLESTLDVVPFTDVSYHVMRSILEFCYTDDLNCTAETVMDLLMSSRVYGIERLKGMVETIVGYSLDITNAPSIFSVAELYSFKRLRKACKFFILSNWVSVTTSKDSDWSQLEPHLIDKLTLKAKNWKII